MGFDAKQQRGLALIFFGPWVGMLVTWCGIITLAVASGMWPDNHIPQALLAVWVLAAAVTGAHAWRRAEPGHRWVLIALAPFSTLFLAGSRCWNFWKSLRR